VLIGQETIFGSCQAIGRWLGRRINGPADDPISAKLMAGQSSRLPAVVSQSLIGKVDRS
jgi:hypothetical protein